MLLHLPLWTDNFLVHHFTLHTSASYGTFQSTWAQGHVSFSTWKSPLEGRTLNLWSWSIPLGYCSFSTCSGRRQWHPTPVLLPGKSHGRRSLVGCSPRDHEESDSTERLHFHFSLSCIGEGNGNPLQCSCLENPRDGWAWWAAVSGVAQSRTRLKQLSSSSSSTMIIKKLNYFQFCHSMWPLGDFVFKTENSESFPGGPVVKNPHFNARNTSLIPGPGRPRIPRSNCVHAQLRKVAL